MRAAYENGAANRSVGLRAKLNSSRHGRRSAWRTDSSELLRRSTHVGPCCQRDRRSILPGAFGTRRVCWSCRAYRVQRGKGPASALTPTSLSVSVSASASHHLTPLAGPSAFEGRPHLA